MISTHGYSTCWVLGSVEMQQEANRHTTASQPRKLYTIEGCEAGTRIWHGGVGGGEEGVEIP